MRTLTFLFLLVGASVQVFAQSAPLFWKQIDDKNISLAENAHRAFVPNAYTAFQLDYQGIKEYLKNAPREWTEEGIKSPLHVQLPNADGSFDTYAVVESPLLSEGDQIKYSDVKTYNGYSVDTPGKVTRFSCTMLGLNAILITPDRQVAFLEALAKNQTEYYMAYQMTDFPEEFWPKLPAINLVDGKEQVEKVKPFMPQTHGNADRSAADLVKVKIYKFACATTGQFSQDHGGTAQSVLAAMTNYMNQLNAMYEYDLDIRLVFVDNVASIFFLDPLTDPYTGSTVGEWMSQNPVAMNTTLGNAGYDIGHVFARYMGGDAIGVAGGLCCTQSKGRGCSAGNTPYGAGFLSVIGQEIGHQWNGGHTWNHCGANDQYTAASAFEPGSGSTIMSYAGACGSDNVQNFTDLYYHSGSIDEIRVFVENDLGATCGTEVTTTNHIPEVTLPYPNGFFIPIGTPFEVRGDATDADGDVLTYCWEGMDLGVYTALGQQQGTSPLYRTFPPSSAKNRVFPRMSAVIANQVPVTELLPLISRDVKLRLTVRDNKPGGGGVGIADLEFRSTDKAGPFKVLSPSSVTEIFTSGTCSKITWDVANTDKAPVNCQTVNIRLSTDGGNTYPTTLATGEPNDGIAYVTFPANVTSTTARVRIDAADNIFFDISNANFRIVNPTAAAFSLCMGDDVQQICLPETFKTTFSASAIMGFNGSVGLAVTGGLPAGAVATFSKPSIVAGETSELTINMNGVSAEGTYDVVVTATSGTQTETRNIKFIVYSNVFTDFKPLTPLSGTTGLSQTPALTWQTVPDANTYEIELATSATFAPNTLVASKIDLTGGSFAVPVLLEKGKVYYWRVRTVNECGKHDWSETFAFATLNESCSTLSATDLPKNISTGNNVMVSSTIFISGGAVSDVNVKRVGIFHDFFKDLKFSLTHPDGTNILLTQNKCGNSSGNFIFGYDDAAPNTFVCPPGNLGTAYKPESPLSALNGKDALGVWKLDVSDTSPGGGGTLQVFEVEVCATQSVSPPFMVNNNILQVQGGANALVTDALLKADDIDDTPENIRFVMLSNTKYGVFELAGIGVLGAGSSFTQEEINNGRLRYYHHGWSGLVDDFKFIVTDSKGGMFGTTAFQIQPLNVAIDEPTQLVDFALMPIPTLDVLTLRFSEPVSQELNAQVLSVDGRVIQQAIVAAGTETKQLMVSQLMPGMYFVRLTDGVRQSTAKFVKQ